VGGLEGSEGGLEGGDVGAFEGLEGKDGDASTTADGAAPTTLCVADGSGVWVDHGAIYVNKVCGPVIGLWWDEYKRKMEYL